MSLTSIDLLTRKKAVHNAFASVRISGGTPSPIATALLANWVTGELTLEKVLAQTQEFYATKETRP